MRLPGPIEKPAQRLRQLLSRADRRVLIGGGALLVAIVIAVVVINPFGGGGKTETRVVTIAVATDNAEQAPVGVLGFPLVATRNTTRISGPDPTSDAAAAALATHPPAPGASPLEAAILVPDDDWQAGVAASVFSGPPLRAPILLTQGSGIPSSTSDALSELNPKGGGASGKTAVYTLGGAPSPSGFSSQAVGGSSPAEVANSIDQLRQKLLRREPQHIVIASGDQSGYATPAAAWAARSGDPVLFSGRDNVPAATLAALRRHPAAPVYILGPESVISKKAEQGIARIAATVTRIGATGVVQNALLFARYSDGSFGWNINDPGHGMVLASSTRPLDAAAAASLSASGKWGPLLLTDTADVLPPELRSFLLDIKPGYETDPTRAVYNHIWLMGDATAIGGEVQAEVDDLAELAPVGGNQAPAAGGAGAGGGAGSEPEVTPSQQKGKTK